MLSSLAILASLCLLLYGLGRLIHQIFIYPMRSPLRLLPAPKVPSYIFGNMKEIVAGSPSEPFEQWIEQMGNTFTFKDFLNNDLILTVDMRALSHVLMHSMDYQKPDQTRKGLGRLIGEGVLVTEGEQHRRQRRIMNPSFAPVQIKALTPIFFQKAQQLRDMWNSSLENKEEAQTIDVLSWLSRATLDIIGLAGFGYHFHALNEKPTELSKALSVIFNDITEGIPIFALLAHFIPILQRIPTKRSRQEDQAQHTMKTIGRQLINERKQAIMRDKEGLEGYIGGDNEAWNGPGKDGKDLLSVLIKANMDTDLPESQRLSDDDVLAQIPTFTVAGHETTSSETTWCLHALSTHQNVQTKLRTELLSVSTDTPSMDELMALPYLDAVVRETMRVHSSVTSTIRVAMKDDIIPLNDPYTDAKGQVHREIKITEGDKIILHIAMVNMLKSIWGKDAMEFNPERWTKLPDAASNIPGVWGNILTFIGGARSCIGYRFALVEMKALIFTLVRSFEFEGAVPAEDIYGKSIVVTRPYVRSQKEKGAQMPLRVRLHKRENVMV